MSLSCKVSLILYILETMGTELRTRGGRHLAAVGSLLFSVCLFIDELLVLAQAAITPPEESQQVHAGLCPSNSQLTHW